MKIQSLPCVSLAQKGCLPQTFVQKGLGQGLIPGRVLQVAEAVAGVGDGEAADQGRVGGGHGLGHIGGNEAVVGAVDDLDGHGGALHRLMAADLAKAEAMAEEEGAHLQEGPHES